MGMTITEKIIAAHCGEKSVAPGQFVIAGCDLMMGHDVTSPPAIKQLKKFGIAKVHNPEAIALVNDHFVPNKDIESAEQAKMMREFASEQGITKYFEVGRSGVCHALLPEQGLVAPGDLIIGADSHTCTYGALGALSTGVGSTDLAAAWATGKIWLRVPQSMKFNYSGKLADWVFGKDLILKTIGAIGVDGARYKAMEFTGPAASELSVFDRLTMANMAIEAGGKNGIFEPDGKVEEFLKGRSTRSGAWLKSDSDAAYSDVVDINCGEIEPLVACPSLPENVKTVSELGDVRVDQVVVGSCTNGWLSDIRLAADIIKGKKVAAGVRMIVIPATQRIYLDAMREGLLDIFVEAGAVVSTPTCGPCLGGYMGILAKGETAVSTTNRNFIGRMGHLESFVYLSNPAVAAASAVSGKIEHPGNITKWQGRERYQ